MFCFRTESKNFQSPYLKWNYTWVTLGVFCNPDGVFPIFPSKTQFKSATPPEGATGLRRLLRDPVGHRKKSQMELRHPIEQWKTSQKQRFQSSSSYCFALLMGFFPFSPQKPSKKCFFMPCLLLDEVTWLITRVLRMNSRQIGWFWAECKGAGGGFGRFGH